jgi:hypothetical protein
MRKVALILTGLAMAVSFPVLSSADKGGVPHSNKPCKAKKKPKKHPKPNNRGKKCGFNFVGTTTAVPTVTLPPPTDTTTTTETTTTTASQ